MTKKFNIWEPIMAPIGEPYPGPKHEEIEEEWDDRYFELTTNFLMAKILEIYMVMDPHNFNKNKEHLEEELEIYIKNHNNEKPNTSDI